MGKQIKYGAAVPVYNREWHIGPFLEQMDDLGIECVIVMGDSSWPEHAHQEFEKPDRTEAIIDRYFPHMKKLSGRFYSHNQSVNPALKELMHCDVNFVNDCDIYFTMEDWQKCFKFIEDNIEYGAFSIDFEKMIKEYYYNYNYGRDAIKGGDVPLIAVRPPFLINHMTQSNSPHEIVWSDDSVKMHHMRWCYKGTRLAWGKPIAEPESKEGYEPAPQEVINRIQKWEKILADWTN